MYNELPQNFMLTVRIILSYLLILSIRNLARDQLDDFSSPLDINSVTWRYWTDGWPGLSSPWWSIPGILVGMARMEFLPFGLGTSLHILSWWLRISCVITPRVLSVGCKTYTHDSEIQGYHFYLILLVRQVTKAHPDSRGELIKQLDSIF